MELYRGILGELKQRGVIYPCTCSRQDVLRAAQAPHQGEEEPVYPGTCRNRSPQDHLPATKINWRFRISEGEKVRFSDGNFGAQQFIAGHDFGDFVAWRHDDIPSYQLACVVDDHMMKITEVVRGADLLMSTARQLLIYRSLDWEPPAFYHCELLRDEHGERLAKRHDSLSLRALRAQGASPGQLSIYGGGQSG
jgi:glutamyl-tRNA synthetase